MGISKNLLSGWHAGSLNSKPTFIYYLLLLVIAAGVKLSFTFDIDRRLLFPTNLLLCRRGIHGWQYVS